MRGLTTSTARSMPPTTAHSGERQRHTCPNEFFVEGTMDHDVSTISELLHEASETHHRVYRIVDGADPDWASWYADWLIKLSELPQLLGATPVHSELVYLLVKLDKDYSSQARKAPWERSYAAELRKHFAVT